MSSRSGGSSSGFRCRASLAAGCAIETTIAAWLAAGLDRVIVGTQALRDPDWFRAMIQEYPGRLVLGLDAREGKVATQGWLETSTMDATALAAQFDGLPLAGIIYTDIARDGTLEGPNLEATRTLAEAVRTPVIASGRRGLPGRPRSSGEPADRRLHRRAGPLRGEVLACPGDRRAGEVSSPTSSR